MPTDDLVISTWIWGTKYSRIYLDRLKSALDRNLKREFRFAVFHPQEEDEYLTKIKGCFARLRMFDPEWQARHGIFGRLVCLDLDVVITGELDPVFDRSEDFVILQGANSTNPCPYNGSMMMLRAGAHPEVWRDFSIEEANTKTDVFDFSDDQGWLAYKVPNAAGWKAGEGGVYGFQKPGWPGGSDLPKDARIVVFPGWRDPAKFVHLKWVRENWI